MERRHAEWHSRGQRFDPAYLHFNARIRTIYIIKNVFVIQVSIADKKQMDKSICFFVNFFLAVLTKLILHSKNNSNANELDIH